MQAETGTRLKPLSMSFPKRKALWLVYRTHSEVGLNFLAGEPSHLSDSQVPSLSDTHTYKSYDWSEWTEQSLQHINESSDRHDK